MLFTNKKARASAQPEASRRLDRITAEADLETFRQSDPMCLPSALHGDARFAWVQHLWRASMFSTYVEHDEGKRGYPLSAACFSDGGEGRVEGYVQWPHEGHRLIVGSPGSGKFTCAIAPLLLSDDGSNAFVIDPKGGEGFRHTAAFRHDLREKPDGLGIRIMDPCEVFDGLRSESLNPLDVIRSDNKNVVGDVDKLVDALVVVSGHEREQVWPLSAKKTLRALILHVATYPSSARRGPKATLMDVQRIVSEGVSEAILTEMASNVVADGLVQRAAMEISDLQIAEGTWRGVKFQIDASLAFLDNLGVRRTLEQTSFDIRELRQSRASLYVVLPNKEKEALGRWLRLIYTTVIDQIDREPGRNVDVIIDEFAALGKFDRVLTDLATQRSAGMRFHLAIQDLNQLNELYGHGWQTIVGNCAVRQFLGVNDNFTAEYVSRALGQTTLHDGDDIQHLYPDAPPTRRPRFVGRELMTPAEVLGLDRDKMIVFADRCARPMRLFKAAYYDLEVWRDRACDMSQANARRE